MLAEGPNADSEKRVAIGPYDLGAVRGDSVFSPANAGCVSWRWPQYEFCELSSLPS